MQPPPYPPERPHGRDEVGESSRDAHSLPNPHPRTQGGEAPASAANGIPERSTSHQRQLPDGHDETEEQPEGHDLARGRRAQHRQSPSHRYRLFSPYSSRSNDPPDTIWRRMLGYACIGCPVLMILGLVGLAGFAIHTARNSSGDNS